MSMLNTFSDYSTTPVAVRRSIQILARGFFRAVHDAFAAIIAQREYRANLEILRRFTDRELRDIGLDRGRIGAGLAQAAKERALNQLSLTRPSRK
ncbi:DUF1127 domain-containing protein [Bradyrhizobium lablabi]|uniref:DUF1127 domain-containing protein n=1 Tax=Bradyrhizobium lablabi TaxID=722472 RepID=UPI001BAA0410|nr:DUF1127 domain-containing protein [Bradyrhizobium lablabi]MBR1123654.1 DUF1127 domain-containing protein [Bradyrhizobium lablabi]